MTESTTLTFDEVRAIHRRESEEQKVVEFDHELPHSYELISNEWLTSVVCKDSSNIQITGFALDAADEGATNRRRISLVYSDETSARKQGLPVSVFCKASQTLASRFIVGLLGVAENEAHFYNVVRPSLNIEAPEGVFALSDKASLNSIIMLRDLGSEVEFCQHTTEITRKRAESQLSLLAKLHSQYMTSADMRELADCYGTVEEYFAAIRDAAKIDQAFDRALSVAEQYIPDSLLSRRDSLWRDVEQSFQCHGKLARTLVHNDPHLKNWYITKDDVMGLNDWQTCAKGHWSRDVGFTLATSLSIPNRRRWERELLEFYLDQLEQNTGKAEDYDEAFDQYRRSIPGSLLMWMGAIAPDKDAPQMQPEDACLEFISRLSQAWEDLDVSDCFE